MSYTIETVNGCTRKIMFNFDTVDLTPEIKIALNQKQKETNIKGYRKGKAPIHLIEKMYKLQIENDALRQFVSKEYSEVIEKEEIKTVGYPMFDETKYEPEKKAISFNATIEIFPEVSVADYSSYSFSKDSSTIEDSEIDEMRNRYMEGKSKLVEIEDENQALEKGLTSVINFQGVQENGDRPENMKGEEFLLEIGSNQFIPGFEDAIIGMKKGEEKVVDLNFPKDYHVEELKDAKVKFEVKLLEIKKKDMPEFTDELAKEFGYDSTEDFVTKTRSMLLAQKEKMADQKLQQEILDKLIVDNPFEIPSALVQQQRKSVEQDLDGRLKQQGFTDEMVSEYFVKYDDDMNNKSTFQVKSALILDFLANKYEIKTSDEDLEKKIDEMASQANMEREQLETYYKSNESIKNNLQYAIREEKTFEKLIAEMDVK